MPDFTIETNINQVMRQWGHIARKFPEFVQDGIERTARDIRADLDRSVATWEHNVDFDVSIQRQGKMVTTAIGTDDEIFGYVDQGTRAHIITPRRPGYPLRFRSGYRAKTAPGRIWAQTGGAFGNWVRAMYVNHPGTKPRRILETIGKKHETSLLRYINLAIASGISKLGFRAWGR